MYDGASATAEAVLMARRLRPDRPRVILSRGLHPHYRGVVETYVSALDLEMSSVPWGSDGRIDERALGPLLDERALCLVVGYPNVLGCIENVGRIAQQVHAAGGLVITATPEPLALAAIRSPGGAGVDIAVAEGQSFGLPVSYGGPGLGLLATRERFVRSMPGRLVGETTDARGQRGYVLTLATREQHIRRERATSNICTNQGLCSLAVTVYLSMLGRQGLQRLARSNRARARQAADLYREHGCSLMFEAPHFNEFVVHAPAICRDWEAWVDKHGVIPGYPVERWFPDLSDGLLVCATEIHDDASMRYLAKALAETRASK